MPGFAKDYQSLAAEKKLQRQNKIPKEWLLPLEKYHGVSSFMDVPASCEVLNDVEYKITSDYDATALLEQLRAGNWSAEQVTIAFCKRAAIAQQLVCQNNLHLSVLSSKIITIVTVQLFDRDLFR